MPVKHDSSFFKGPKETKTKSARLRWNQDDDLWERRRGAAILAFGACIAEQGNVDSNVQLVEHQLDWAVFPRHVLQRPLQPAPLGELYLNPSFSQI